LTGQRGKQGWLISVSERSFKVHWYWVSCEVVNELNVLVRSTKGPGSMLISTLLSKFESDDQAAAVRKAIHLWENEPSNLNESWKK
jgi:hypothetical protein